MALIEFKNKPNTTTPINDKNLNHNFKELKEMVKTEKITSDEDTYSCNYINNNLTQQIKRINKLIKSGESLTDSDILKTKSFVVIHYSINSAGYLKSMIVQVGNGTWYYDVSTVEGYHLYFRIDWGTGTIYVSDGSTVSNAVGVVGYDILM